MSGKTRILIADDDAEERSALFRLLSRRPEFDVVGTVESGEQACVVAAAHPPDVILMDVQMPGLGGIDATRWVVSQAPGVRVVGMSAAEDSTLGGEMRAAGAVDFVLKTAGLDRLVAALRAAAGDAMSHRTALDPTRTLRDDRTFPTPQQPPGASAGSE